MSYQQKLLLYLKIVFVFFIHSQYCQYCGVSILVTAASYDEMQQTLPMLSSVRLVMIWYTDASSNLLLADRRKAISDLQSENSVVSL